jgi:hypothetical protein
MCLHHHVSKISKKDRRRHIKVIVKCIRNKKYEWPSMFVTSSSLVYRLREVGYTWRFIASLSKQTIFTCQVQYRSYVSALKENKEFFKNKNGKSI